MKTTEKLDELAALAYRTNGSLLATGDYLHREHAPDHITDTHETARRNNNRLLNGLVALGAADPCAAMTRRIHEERGLPPPRETPIHLLSSDAAQLYARTIREAAVACLAMEKERGIEDGLGEILSDYADIAELEVFGPAGLE